MAQKENQAVTDTLLILGGSIVGAGLALLFAPQTGKKTREDLAAQAKKFQGKANEAVYEITESINDFMTSVGNRSAEILNAGEELTQESKKELLAALEKGEENLARLKEKLAQMTN